MSEIRLKNLEATIADLRRERREDRALIKEILGQVLSLTDRQTQLLQEWTGMIAERRRSLAVDRAPVSYTLTEGDEYVQWLQKHHPEMVAEDREVGYNSSDRPEDPE